MSDGNMETTFNVLKSELHQDKYVIPCDSNETEKILNGETHT